MRIWMMMGAMSVIGAIGAAEVSDLEDLKWKRRAVLLFGDLDSKPAKDQLAEWESEGIPERDITVIRVNESPAAAELTTRFSAAEGQFMVILLGKDGGEKLRTRQFLPNAELFALIDAMPMRQREMQERSAPDQ